MMDAKTKDAIINARGESKLQAVGSRRYIIHLENGTSFTCIDLVNDPPEEVKAGIREMFGKYGIKDIEH